MTNKKRFKKIPVIIIIILLFFTFSFLIGSTNGKAEIPLKLSDENILMDDGEEDSNGEEGKTGKGLNIDALISLVQEATMKHLEILKKIRIRAPEAAWGGLDRAIEASIRGSNRAIEALSKIKPSKEDNDNKGLKKFHIISSCNRGGTITPKGIQFFEGGSFTFKINADPGYTLLWIRVDNEKQEGAIETDHTFSDIDSNHTIHAHFKKDKGSAKPNGDID
jgi:hypothetical protein